MRRMIRTVCVLAMMSVSVWAQQPTPPAQPPQKAGVAKHKKKPAHSKAKAVAPAQELPAQTMPPVPATLMNSAPVKPNITMESGLLTIDAPNCTLNDVLNGVRRVTGAVIEGASPTERIAVRLGPGHPEQVISSLLRGTPYDYVILGSQGKNDVVTRVLLTPASASTGNSEPPQTASVPSPAQGRSDLGQPDNAMPERTPPDDPGAQPADTEAEQPQPVQTEQPEQQPVAQPQQQAQPQPQAQPQQDQNQPKTPEQLFKELQQLEQQKQQQQQQQPQ